jgi:hypothetical protein
MPVIVLLRTLLAGAAVLFACAGQAIAQIPQTLHYQGYLTSNAGTPVNGATAITFKLYDAASGGTELWSETHAAVSVTNGHYQVILGNTTPFGVDFSAQYYLGVTVGLDAEMSPRQALTMVPNAYRAVTADNVSATATISAGQISGGTLSGAVSISGATIGGATLAQLQAQFAPSLFGSSLQANTVSTLDAGAEIGSVGDYVALAAGADGLPVIAYQDFTNLDLKVAKCADTTCTGSSTITVVDSAGDVGRDVSMAIGADGFPVIAYFALTGLDLKVAKCANAACTGASTITTVDSAGDVGRNTSIALGADGLPLIAYYDNTNDDLKVAKCGDPACSGPSTITAVDSAGVVGEWASLAIGADGFAVIAYVDATNGDLKVAKCANAACNSGTAFSIVDANVNVNARPSIALGIDGLPVMSYYDNVVSINDLKVAKCVNADCSGSSTITAVDTAGNVGLGSSIVIGADGLPLITYFDFTTPPFSTALLKAAKCANAACTGASTITLLSAAGRIGGVRSPVRLVAGGVPLIAFQESIVVQKIGHVKVATCADASCTSLGSNNLVDAGSGGKENVGQHSSVATPPDGLPIISYYDATRGDLKVAKCADVACTAASAVTRVDTEGDVGEYSSITVGPDGLPVISYHASLVNSLKVVKCGNAACSSGNAISLVDGSPDGATSIAIGVDGLPIIAHYTGDLKVAKCSNAWCDSGNTLTILDPGDAGQYASIAVGSDGLPIISYYDIANGNLKVAKCGNAACSAGNTGAVVDSTGDVGHYTSITVAPDGLPVISYYDVTNRDLKVAKCGNAACSAGNTVTTVDSANDVGQFTSITISADGFPLISYFKSTGADLKLAKCVNAACSGGTIIATLDAAGSVGEYSSISIGQGWPVISYYDESNTALKVVKCSNAFCVPYLRPR